MKRASRKVCKEFSPKGLVADFNKFWLSYRVTFHVNRRELFMGRRLRERYQRDLCCPQSKDKERNSNKGSEQTPIKNFITNEHICWSKCKTQMGLGSQEYSRSGLATVYGKS